MELQQIALNSHNAFLGGRLRPIVARHFNATAMMHRPAEAKIHQ
jgi:hypothetical protein